MRKQKETMKTTTTIILLSFRLFVYYIGWKQLNMAASSGIPILKSSRLSFFKRPLLLSTYFFPISREYTDPIEEEWMCTQSPTLG